MKEHAIMAVVTMRELLDSGVHFGHQTRRWNPKMKRFIFTERNGIYIIDIQQSLALIDSAYEFVKDVVAKGGHVLFVGTKKAAQEPIIAQAARVGMPSFFASATARCSFFVSTTHIALGHLVMLRIPSRFL